MAVPEKGNAAPRMAKHVADWLDSFGSETVTLKCDALAQEIRRMRRESGKEAEHHLAEGTVNIVKGLIRALKSRTESNLRAQLKCGSMAADRRTPTERPRRRSSASCV